jgi:DnaK suppressor protein
MAGEKKKPANHTSSKKVSKTSGATARKKSPARAAKPPARKDTSGREKAASKPPAARPIPIGGAGANSAQLPYLGYLGIAPYQEKKGEAYMNPAQEEHFRKILEAWKGKLIEEMERTVHHMRDEAANFPDPNDRASQESDFALELRTRDRERKLIKKIEESLRNLDNHEYGYCEMCGVEIGIRRLEARPTATLCIDCKTLDEIRERQVKG